MDRIVGQGYMGLEGVFGIPLDVAATYIVLFTIYGAVLEYSGAGALLRRDLATRRSGAAAPARAARPRWPASCSAPCRAPASRRRSRSARSRGRCCAARATRKNEGGGMLAAAGIGAILSPPTLGAAAFIIAEFLEISYLQVLVYALVPTLLYYLGILLAIEADTRRFEVQGLDMETPGFWRLLARWGYHFSSLILIVVLLALSFSPFRRGAVSRPSSRSCSRSWTGATGWARARSGEALVAGARGVLPIAATTRRRRDHRRGRLVHRARARARRR